MNIHARTRQSRHWIHHDDVATNCPRKQSVQSSMDTPSHCWRSPVNNSVNEFAHISPSDVGEANSRPARKNIFVDDALCLFRASILGLISFEPFRGDCREGCWSCQGSFRSAARLNLAANTSPRFARLSKTHHWIDAERKTSWPAVLAIKHRPGFSATITHAQCKAGIARIENVDLALGRRLRPLHNSVGESALHR